MSMNKTKLPIRFKLEVDKEMFESHDIKEIVFRNEFPFQPIEPEDTTEEERIWLEANGFTEITYNHFPAWGRKTE